MKDRIMEKGVAQRLLLVLLFFSLTQPLPVLARERVGIFGFQGAVQEEYQQAAVNHLGGLLMELDRLVIQDRDTLHLILAEQRFQQSGLVDTDTAVEMGRTAGVQQLLMGEIRNLWVFEQDDDYLGWARIRVRIVDVETGKQLHSIEGTGIQYHETREGALSGALADCFSHAFFNQLWEFYAITSFIHQVEGREIYSLGGQDMGIKRGTRYQVFRLHGESLPLEPIGLIEVLEVSGGKARSQIIWQKEPLQENDVLQEVPYWTLGFVSLQLSLTPYQLTQGEEILEGVTPEFVLSYGRERPFRWNWSFQTGLSTTQDILGLQMGMVGSYAFPLRPGILYLETELGIGGSLAFQDTPVGLIQAADFFFSGGGQVKYYLGGEGGVRLQMGIRGQYGPTFQRWYHDTGERIHDLHYPQLSFSGASLQVSLSRPLELDFFRIFNLPARFYQAFVKGLGFLGEEEEDE